MEKKAASDTDLALAWSVVIGDALISALFCSV
jgi:hypothetical protein